MSTFLPQAGWNVQVAWLRRWRRPNPLGMLGQRPNDAHKNTEENTMFNGLTTLSRTVSALFSPPFLFSVPNYQRSYSWTLREALQLLEDIAAAAGIDGGDSAEPDYFLGAILLLAGGRGAPDATGQSCVYDIIDGQQRLATLTILLAVLRELGVAAAGRLVAIGPNESSVDRAFRLQLRGTDQDFFARFVQSPGAAAISPAGEPASPCEAAILDVRTAFLKELGDLDATDRQRLADYVATSCHVVLIEANDIDRAHRLFTVLNERGKPLRRNDILKAEIMHGLTGAEGGEALRHWDQAETRLGRHFEELFSHIRVIHGKTRPQVIAAIRSIIAEAGGPGGFMRNDFVPYAEAYAQILGVDGRRRLHPEVENALRYLNRLSGAEWVPAALLALKLHGSEPDRLRVLIAGIDRLAHLLRIQGLGTGKRARRFDAVIQALLSRTAMEEASGVFELSRDEMRVALFNLRSLHKRNQALCKSVLLRLNDELAGTFTEVDPAAWSVEHVLPGRPSAGSLWRQWFADPNEREACTDSIGNLVLVTTRQNDRARNEEFERKVAVYRTPDSDAPILPITKPVIDSAAWRATDVRAREAELLAILMRIWRIDGSQAAKARAAKA